jgi:hypothetical protein
MNPILTKMDRVQGLSRVAQHIVRHDVSGQYSADVYGDLCKDAVESGAKTKEEWENYLRPAEESVLALREEAGETGLKTKGGKWKLTKVSHNSTYRSNKSVLGNAIEAGLHLVNSDDHPIPKSVLEKALKKGGSGVAGVRVPKTAEERVEAATTTLIKLWPDLSPSKQHEIRLRMESLF